MYRKENTLLILYTLQNKYVVFHENSNKFGFPHQVITEQDDNLCPPLAIARNVLTKISGGFSYEMLNQLVEVKTDSNLLKNKFLPNDWNKLWNSIEYNVWLEELSDSFFTDVHVEGKNYSIYYQLINEQIFAQNMQSLKVDYQIRTQEEIKNNQNTSELTLKIIQSGLNIQKEIQEQENLKNSPPSKENTYLFILHKKIEFKEKLLGGIPTVPTKAFFLGLFKKNNQKWLTYNAGTQNLPPDDIIANTKAIIMPGSASSVYEANEWTSDYGKWLTKTYYNHPHLKFLGICFGEQFLAHTLNGRCGMLEERKLNKDYNNLKVEALTFQDVFYQLPYIQKLNIPKRPLNICKVHGDIVEVLDKNLFQIIGSSEKYKVEVYIDVPKNEGELPNKVLCFQGHPEYSQQWIERKNASFILALYKISLEQAYSKIKSLRSNLVDDHLILRQICYSFLSS